MQKNSRQHGLDAATSNDRYFIFFVDRKECKSAASKMLNIAVTLMRVHGRQCYCLDTAASNNIPLLRGYIGL